MVGPRRGQGSRAASRGGCVPPGRRRFAAKPIAEPEHPQPGEDRDVRVRADQDETRGRTVQAVRLHVPPRPAQDRVPGRGEPGEVRHGRARREADRRAARKAEQVDEPAARDGLDDRGSRRGHHRRRVLVPDAGQPVRRDRGRQATADHEPEEARPRHRHQPGSGPRARAPHHRDGGLTVLLIGPPKTSASWAAECCGATGRSASALAVLDCELRPALKQVGRAGVRIGRPGLRVAGRVLVHLSLADCHGRVRLPSSRPRGRRSTPFGDRMDAPRLTNGACSRMSQANTFATSSRPPTVRPPRSRHPMHPAVHDDPRLSPRLSTLAAAPILPVRGTVRRAEASPSIGCSSVWSSAAGA